MHFGSGEAETACLLGYLEAAAFPLHDVVVADDAFVHEAADAVETFRSRAPGGCVFARLPSQAAGVVRDALSRGRTAGGRVWRPCPPRIPPWSQLPHTPR